MFILDSGRRTEVSRPSSLDPRLFDSFKVESSDVDSVVVCFVSYRFNAGCDAYQLPSFVHHGVYLVVDYCVVSSNVLEADSTDVEEVEELRFFEVLDANLTAVRLVS